MYIAAIVLVDSGLLSAMDCMRLYRSQLLKNVP